MALKELIINLLNWNKKDFGDIKKRKMRNMARLEGIHKAISRNNSLSFSKLKKKLKKD